MAKIIKPLSELKISPSPWRHTDDGMGYRDIKCSCPTSEDYEGEDIIAEAVDKIDANMMVASPKLYDELWKLCFGEHTGSVNCRNCKGAELGNCKKCNLGGARAALLEASGEKE